MAQWNRKTISPPKLLPNLLYYNHKTISTPNLLHFNHKWRPTSHQKPSKYAFPAILKDCATQMDLEHGKVIHSTIIQMGFQSDPHIASSLIVMYSKSGSLKEAAKVFDRIPQRDATLWNTMLSAYFHHDYRSKGLILFHQMQYSAIRPDNHSLSILLAARSNEKQVDIELGKQAHAYIVRNEFESDPFLSTALIDMYANCGFVTEACRVFGAANEKNAIVWNTMIAGFSRNGSWEKSLELFVLMRSDVAELLSSTFSIVLTACLAGEAARFGEGIHCFVVKLGFELDLYVYTSLIAMYGRCISVEGACRLFNGVASKGIEVWNSMISAYVGNGLAYEAIDLYRRMEFSGVRWDCVTVSNVISACGMVGLLDIGRTIHGKLAKQPELESLMVQSNLMTMYMKCGSIGDSKALFSSITEWDVIVWGSMITGFCQNKKFDQALGLFNQLRGEGLRPDSTVLASAVSASTGLEFQHLGLQIHGHAIKTGTNINIFVGSSLIDMYAKYGVIHLAQSVLFDMQYKSLGVWNSMISGYGRNGLLDQSIHCFSEIPRHGLVPDSISITSVLASVSSLAALKKGKMVHGYQIRSEIMCDIHAQNAMLDMYVKCGCLKYALQLFNWMPVTNVVSWNTMIAGLGSHGNCIEAIELFEELQRSKILPDDTTFLSLISSCSHSGLVEEGIVFFRTMSKDYGIMPRIEHYINMVDLLGRAGRLDEAYLFIEDMPIRSDERVWLCLLSACRAHRDQDFGAVAADQILKLMPEGSGSYTQVLNFYGEIGMLDKVASIRSQMREAGMKKNPGCSWIEVRDRVEIFYSGDSSSSLTLEIHDTLSDLRRTMRKADEF